MTVDLTDDETESLARLLRHAIDDDRYPLSPRVQTWKAILGKIHPQTPREPLPPATKVDEPPSKGRYRRR
jgi:hypothetical protein